eukprot:1020604-Prymnesium_polylepis.1
MPSLNRAASAPNPPRQTAAPRLWARHASAPATQAMMPSLNRAASAPNLPRQTAAPQLWARHAPRRQPHRRSGLEAAAPALPPCQRRPMQPPTRVVATTARPARGQPPGCQPLPWQTQAAAAAQACGDAGPAPEQRHPPQQAQEPGSAPSRAVAQW